MITRLAPASHLSPSEATHLREFLIALSASAQLLVDSFSRRRENLSFTVKHSLADVATEADVAMENFIKSRLAEAFPHDGFLGEESGLSSDPSAKRWWIVDPIDGTTNFRTGFGSFGVSVALADAEGLLAGLVLDPTRQERFLAVTGRGATVHSHLGDFELHPPEFVDLDELLIDLAFGTAHARTYFPHLLLDLRAACMDVRRSACASTAISSVAASRLGAYWAPGLQPWDFAAAACIGLEAGIAIKALDGSPLSLTHQSVAGVLAAPTDLWEPLAEIIRPHATL